MRALALGVAVAGLAACSSSSSTYGTAATGHARSTAGAASGASTGGVATASSTGGSSSSASTGGSTGATGSSGTSSSGILVCPPALSDCDAGVELLTQAVDAFKLTPVPGVVQIVDLDNQTITATSGPDAILHVCVDTGTTVAPYLQVSGYADTIFNDIDLATSECLTYVPLLSSSLLTGIVAELPGYDSTQGLLVVFVISGAAAGVCDKAGWSFSLLDPDGGAVAASVAYVSGTSVSTTIDGTTEAGGAFLYNIDPSVGEVRVVGAQAGDGGGCSQIIGAHEYTDGVHIAGNGVTSTFSFVILDQG